MQPKKKILFIIPRFGSINRGVESFSLELISRLNKSLFEITVLSAPHETDIQNVEFIKTKIPLREKMKWLDQSSLLRKIGRRFSVGSGADIESLSIFFKSKSLLKNRKFDIIIPLGGSWTYRLAKQRLQSGSIISIGQAGPVKKDLLMSDLFVALTPFDENLALTLAPQIKTALIPNGVDVKKFKPSNHSVSKDTRTILCVAALSQDKRHDLLFDAVMHLPDNVTVLCIGSGSHKKSLLNHPLVTKGRVKFMSIDYKDMPSVYHQADIFSLASPEETFGIVFLEAIASGLPVIAHDAPRQRYVIGDNGKLVDCFDAKSYAACLKDQLHIADQKSNPKDFNKFHWESITKKYQELFLDITR